MVVMNNKMEAIKSSLKSNKLDNNVTSHPLGLPKKEAPSLDYSSINKPKQVKEGPSLDYANPDMKRDPKKDPNWKLGVEEVKMNNHLKNNPNIHKVSKDEYKVGNKPPVLNKSTLPSSPYNNEVESKIAKMKEKYADKQPKSTEQKVIDLKSRYNKVKPLEKSDMPHQPNSPDDIAHDLEDGSKSLPEAIAHLKKRHDIQKMFTHLRSLKDGQGERSDANKEVGMTPAEKKV